MYNCYKVPAEAWRQLRDARWEKLKKANFFRCLGRGVDVFSASLLSLWGEVAPRWLSPVHMGAFLPGRTAGPGVSAMAPRAQRGPTSSSPRWRGAAPFRTHTAKVLFRPLDSDSALHSTCADQAL